MSYQETKAFIDANIKQNGREEITGPILNTALNAVLDSGYEEVGQLAQKVGNGTLTKVNKGSDDFVGLIWDGSQVVQGNATFNGLLFEVAAGERLSINTRAQLSIVAFPHYPALGQTDGTPITGNEYVVAAGINYILVTVDVSASTSAHDVCILYKIQSGALGSISEIQNNLYPQKETVESYDRQLLSGLVYDTGANRVINDLTSDYGAYLLELRPYTDYTITPAGAIVGIYLFDRFPTISTSTNAYVGNSFNSGAYKYALINVLKNNASINVETGSFYLFNDRVQEINGIAKEVGNGTLTKVNKGSDDFIGLIWDGSQVVQGNATFNGLLFKVVEDEHVSINIMGEISIVAFPDYPTIGQTTGEVITNKDYVVASGINYILVTVDVSASTSAHDVCILYKIPSGALGSIANIQRDLYPQNKTTKSYGVQDLSGLLYATDLNRVINDLNSAYGAYLLELKPYANYNLTPAGSIVGVYLFDRFPTISTSTNVSVGNSFNSGAYKYALINVLKNNANIQVETGAFYLFNDRVQEINGIIGKELIDRIYTSSDYSGLMWDGSTIYPASANFNSFIIKVEKGREYRVAAAHPILSVAAFGHYPALGNTDGVTLSRDTFDFSFTPNDGQNYIVVTIPLVSGTTQISLSSKDSGLTRTLRIANPLCDKKIITFGDSLTDFVDDDGYGYTYYMANMIGADCLCGGFGGARISKSRGYHVTPASDQEAESAFDLPNLFSAIINNNWTAQDNAVNYYGSHLSSEIGEKWRARIAKLKAVDWSQVDTITIFAGTNDWANAVDLGASGSGDETCVLGAINVITQMITANFPKIRVHWFTPIVRWIASTLQDRTDANWSDNYRPGGGITLREFSEAVYNEVLRNHLPCYDTYNRLGWTKYNFSQYFIDSDGTHPYKGFEYIGKRFASVLQAER